MSKKYLSLAIFTILTINPKIHTLEEKKTKLSVIGLTKNYSSIKNKQATSNQQVIKHIPQTLTEIFKPHVSGYIKHEAYWDSRQVVGFQSDQTLAFPEAKLPDSQGNDINAKGQFTMVDIETNLHLGIDGPDILGAKSYGQIEVNFYGINEQLKLNVLYTTFIRLLWKKWGVLFGQWWHPMFLLDNDPHTIQFNSGAPIAAYGKGPGIFASYYHNNQFEIKLVAQSVLDFDDGPDGFRPKYLLNAIVPRLHALFQFYFQTHVGGFGLDFKRIKPRLSSTANGKTFKVNEHLNSFSAHTYLALHFPSVDIRSQLIYGENTVDLGQIGGYAVASIDPITGKQTYKNLRVLSGWLDVNIVKSKKVIPGFFIGYLRNIGASDCIIPNEVDIDGNITKKNVFGFGQNIKHEFRVAPRIRWKIKKLKFGLEFDYTSAGFGTVEKSGKIENVDTVSNFRLMFATYYNF